MGITGVTNGKLNKKLQISFSQGRGRRRSRCFSCCKLLWASLPHSATGQTVHTVMWLPQSPQSSSHAAHSCTHATVLMMILTGDINDRDKQWFFSWLMIRKTSMLNVKRIQTMNKYDSETPYLVTIKYSPSVSRLSLLIILLILKCWLMRHNSTPFIQQVDSGVVVGLCDHRQT